MTHVYQWIIVILVIFTIVIYVHKMCITTTKIDIESAEKFRRKISSKVFGDSYDKCLSVALSSSFGLIADASIVCNITRNMKTPRFYFEDFDQSSPDIKNSWFFPNLDCTNFSSLFSDKSPNTLICKTIQTYNTVKPLFPNKNVIYTGFTSFDRYLPNTPKDFSVFLHVVGKSPFKGTMTLVKIWMKHPEWPMLTITANKNIPDLISDVINGNPVRNLTILRGMMGDVELKTIQNTYGLHICSSIHEGFGHYIHEAKSTGAVVLYTDAPSMNETFTDGVNGIAIESVLTGYINSGLCPYYSIIQTGLERAVKTVINTPREKLVEIGMKARESFLRNKSDFEDQFLRLVRKLGKE